MATLTLTDDETTKARAWNEEHLAKEHRGKEPYSGAIGGRLTYRITYTSLGEIVRVECGRCRHLGKPEEVYACTLTDFDFW